MRWPGFERCFRRAWTVSAAIARPAVVVLNLFVALQESVSLAAHWLADEGLVVPPTYGEVFRSLGERGVVPADLAVRLAAASGFRNLVAHRYGALD